jgi:hypothetical protein
MTNLEGMMLMMDRNLEILRSIQSISNFETLIISPITSGLTAIVERLTLRSTDTISNHIISNQGTLTKILNVITSKLDQPPWCNTASESLLRPIYTKLNSLIQLVQDKPGKELIIDLGDNIDNHLRKLTNYLMDMMNRKEKNLATAWGYTQNFNINE